MDRYEPLYNRYRPESLDDVIGQRVAVGKVDGMLVSGKLARTIMISGPSGVGKTTIARLIARYLNCEHGPKKICMDLGKPRCRSCQTLLKNPPPDTSDYRETNAADERGIDGIRDLIRVSAMHPQTNFRVFCLDEAHQLTGPAFQTLQKPFEEPSPKSLWIICTTMPGKIPASIKNRCFDLSVKKLTTDEMVEVLDRVLDKEEQVLPSATVRAIADSAQGSPRAGLSALESVLAYIQKNQNSLDEVTPQLLEEVVKLPAEAVVRKYLWYVLNGQVASLDYMTKAESPVMFLTALLDAFEDFMFRELQTSRVSGPSPWEKFGKRTKKFSVEDDMKTFSEMHLWMMEAVDKASTYAMDPARLANQLTLRLLGITTKWRDVE